MLLCIGGYDPDGKYIFFGDELAGMTAKEFAEAKFAILQAHNAEIKSVLDRLEGQAARRDMYHAAEDRHDPVTSGKRDELIWMRTAIQEERERYEI